MSKKNNQILNILVNYKKAENTIRFLSAQEKKALLSIESVHVITERTFSGIVDHNWYIGEKEYEYLLDECLFRYMRNLRSLRLHYFITEEEVIRKLHLPHEFQGFSYLSSEERIRKLPDDIGELTNLVTLDIAFTHINNLPDSVVKLSNLEYLFLNNSLIKNIPTWIGSLRKLQIITLMSLKLRSIPEDIMRLELPFKDDYKYHSWEKGIFIKNLSIATQPVSLFYQPRDFIIDYYKQPKIAVNETKVIFLGSEGVGKTHTIKRILNDSHKIIETLKETPGISITYKDFAIEDFTYRINFWDFGGQEIMHAMHRCFLTNRTGYVIVVSTRYGDVTAQARVWLRNLRSFAKDAPVIVFVNVWNDGTYYGIDESKLRHEFNNIESIIHCSARDSETRAFAALTEAIQKLAVKNDSIGMHFPKTWENVRQEIIAEGRKHNCIDSEQYKAICNKYNVTDPSIQGWLLDWFNDLGECFTYQSGEEIVSGERYSMILNPEWLTNAVYLIIREMGDTAEKGVVAHKIIKNLLVTSKNGTKPGLIYSEDDCEYILEVMRKHQLSYKIPAKEKEFIPALLKDSSDEITIPKGKDSIRYEMQYDYLPKNVLHNLLVEYYVLVDEDKCWRNRFVVQVEGMEETEMAAVISADYESNVISIQIEQYTERETWESLQAIRNKIFEINEKLNLTARDFIVVDSKDEDGRAERANLKRLLKLQERGVERYEAYERGFDIYKLLGKAFGEAAVENVKAALQIDKDISIEGLIAELGKQGARDLLSAKIQELVSIENIYEYIMSACMIIQKRMIFWSKPGHDVPEDARNDEMRDLLGSRGLFVRDQTHTGYGATGKNPGEVDLMILKPQGDLHKEMTLVEAMNLSGVTTAVITKHLNKLVVGYNSSGLRELFLVSYVELEMRKFSSFWENYKSTVLELNGKEFIVDNEAEPVINEELAWIKSIKVTYDCRGQRFCVYHICARVAE